MTLKNRTLFGKPCNSKVVNIFKNFTQQMDAFDRLTDKPRYRGFTKKLKDKKNA